MDGELILLEFEIEKQKLYINNLSSGYENIARTVDMHRDIKNHSPSEELAYMTLTRKAASQLGDCLPMDMVAMPSSLGELSQESFKLRVKAIANTVWRAISEAASKLKKLLSRWFTKIKELIFGTSNESTGDDINELVKAVEKSENLFKDYDFKAGQVVPDDEFKKIKEAHPDTEFFRNEDGSVLGKKDLERNMLDGVRDSSDKYKNTLMGVSRNGSYANIESNVKDALETLRELNKDEYVQNVLTYTREMVNITSRDELNKFLDNSKNLSGIAYEDMMKALTENGRGDSGESKEILGGVKLTFEKQKTGNFIYPQVDVSRRQPKAPSGEVTFTLGQLLNAVSEQAAVAAEVDKSHKTFDILANLLEEITAAEGKQLEASVGSIKAAATEREAKDAETMISELKAINKIINGWMGIPKTIVEQARAVHNAIENVAVLTRDALEEKMDGAKDEVDTKAGPSVSKRAKARAERKRKRKSR